MPALRARLPLPQLPRLPRPRDRSDRPQDSISSWPIADRIGYALCWASGIALCTVTARRGSRAWSSPVSR
jgi:hypothetical protein